MFEGCNNLETLSLTCPKVSEIGKMFSTDKGFGNVKNLTLGDLSSTRLISGFFLGNTNLTNVTLSNPRGWTAASAFRDCNNLIKFDGYNLHNVENCSNMFLGCSNLKTVILRHCGNNNELNVG